MVKTHARRIPRQQRSMLLVRSIVEAAAHSFTEAGFEAATTNEIAARAGVSIGSLYQYFPDKVALLAAVKDRHLTSLYIRAARACNQYRHLPWPLPLEHLVHTIVDVHRETDTLQMQFRSALPADLLHPPVLQMAPPVKAALQTHDAELTAMLKHHSESIAVGADEAARMIPIIGRGVFLVTLIDEPGAIRNGQLASRMLSLMLKYLS